MFSFLLLKELRLDVVVDERSGWVIGLLRGCYQKKRKLWGGSLGCFPFLSPLFGNFLLSVADFLR